MIKKLVKLTPLFLFLTFLFAIFLTLVSPFAYNFFAKEDGSIICLINNYIIGGISSIIIFYGYKMSKLACLDFKFRNIYIDYLKVVIKLSLILFIVLIYTNILWFNLVFLTYFIFIGVFGLMMVVLRELFRVAYEMQTEIDHTV